MIINPFIFGGEYLVFLVRGNSIAAGAGNGSDPVSSQNIIFEYTGGVLVDRYNTAFSSSDAGGGNPGSWMKQLGIDLNTATGKKIVFIAAGLSGAELYPNGGTDTHWDPFVDNAGAAVPGGTGSVLYTNSVSNAAACLTLLDKTSLDGVIDCDMFINDIRGAASLSDIATAITAFYNQTHTDFANVPIYVAQPGQVETASVNQRISTVRKNLRQRADSDSLFHLCINLGSFTPQSWLLYRVDNLHLSQAGNNQCGSMLARYILSGESNKEVRQVFNCFYQDLDAGDKAVVKTFIEGCQSDGNWVPLESLQIYRGAVRNNVLCDWRYLGSPADSAFDFAANDAITTNTGKYIRGGYLPAYSWIGASQNDFIVGAKTGVVTTAAGTLGFLFGVSETAPGSIYAGQTVGSTLAYIANDKTGDTYAGRTKFQDETHYAAARSASNTIRFFEGSTQVDTATITSTGIPTIQIYGGSRNQNGAENGSINSEIYCFWAAKYSTFNLSAFLSRLDTLLTGLA